MTSWIKNKFRLVAARASDALGQMADIVAPTLYESNMGEFHHRWQTVARFLDSVMSRDLEPSEQRRLLLDSHTRESLQRLVLLIYSEENTSDRLELSLALQKPSALGDGDAQQLQHAPRECLEYLLEKQIISHLCEFGVRDQPSGIMSLSLQFVGALLSRVNYPILPTREVHVSVVALIQAAAKKEVEDPVVRKCLITLLNILWKKLRGDPVQTEFFFLNADRLMVRKSEVVRRSRTASSDHTLQSSVHQSQQDVAELILFTAMLPHMYAVGKIGEKCREALVIAASVPERALCRFVLQLTPFCHYAVTGVIAAYDNLPKTLSDVTPNARGGLSGHSGSSPRRGIETEIGALAMKLRFCCTLTMVARYEILEVDEDTGEEIHRSIANELLQQFRTRFFEGPLLEGLLSTSESTSRTAMVYSRIILEELASCGRDTRANPLLTEFIDFLLQLSTAQNDDAVRTGDVNQTDQGLPAEVLPMKLLHHMDSLSSSLSIATLDLFTYLLDLQDSSIDRALLGEFDDDGTKTDRSSEPKTAPSTMNAAIRFASHFPESAVASNVHLWKIRAFASIDNELEIPAADDSEDQVLSLLSYIADAEYATCQRFPGTPDDTEESEDDENDPDDAGWVQDSTTKTEEGSRSDQQPDGSSSASLTSPKVSRTAATRNAMKPLKDVYLSMALPSFSPVIPPEVHQQRSKSISGAQSVLTDPRGGGHDGAGSSDDLPLFLRIVFNRAERVLENSFQENLALSGLLYALAQKSRCFAVVFDLDEVRPKGSSLRSILEDVYTDAVRRINRLSNGGMMVEELRKKLIEDDNDASLNSHEAESRLLCGYVVLEEMLKELCSLLFARERVKALPLRPEDFYQGPKRSSADRPRTLSSETLYSDVGSSNPLSPSGGDGEDAELSKTGAISKEFEELLAEAESSMESLLVSVAPSSDGGSGSDDAAAE